MKHLSRVAFDEGARQKAIEAARNLLSMKVCTYEQIAQATGLAVDEIMKLADVPD